MTEGRTEGLVARKLIKGCAFLSSHRGWRGEGKGEESWRMLQKDPQPRQPSCERSGEQAGTDMRVIVKIYELKLKLNAAKVVVFFLCRGWKNTRGG